MSLKTLREENEHRERLLVTSLSLSVSFKSVNYHGIIVRYIYLCTNDGYYKN